MKTNRRFKLFHKSLKMLDWSLILGSVIIMSLIFAFPEVSALKVIGYILGIIGALYLLGILRCFIFNRIAFDWYLVKGNFLRKVAALVFVFPLVIMMGIEVLSEDNCSKIPQENMEYVDGQDVSAQLQADGNQHSLLWSIVTYYINPGASGDACERLGRRWTIAISVFSFLLLNSMLISALVGWLSKRREDWSKGKVRYKWFRNIGKNRFAVVIGTNEVAASVIKNLLTEKDGDEINLKCEGRNKYVILQTDRKSDDVRLELAAYIGEDDLKRVVVYKAMRNSKSEIENLYLKYATEIYVLGESALQEGGETNHDALNMRCVNLIAKNLKKENSKGKKVCKVMFEYQETYSVFLFSDVFEEVKEKLEFIPFNRCESWARKVVVESSSEDSIGNRIEYTPLDGKNGISKDSDEHVHFVIVGMSKMGVAMGVQALSQAHYINYAAAENIEDAELRERRKDKTRTRITFIDANADKEMNMFKCHYANLFELVRHRYIDADNYDKETKWIDPMKAADCRWGHLSRDGQNFLDVEIEFVKGEVESEGVRQYLKDMSDRNDAFVKDSKLTIAICLPHTNQSIAASLYMPVEVYGKAQDIWVYQREVSDIIRNLENTDKIVSQRYKKMHPFGMLYGEYMSDRSQYLKAILVNWAYDAINSKDLDWPTSIKDDNDENWKKAKESWSKLGLDKQWSNRYFVDHIEVKKRSLGMNVIENLKGYSEEDLLLGITEHNRWNMEQLLFGYLPCDKELDEIFEKINKEGLSDSVKDEYEAWKRKNGVNKTDYKKIKDDVKGLEYRIHPNICEFLHLDDVDKEAKGYDSMLNNAIVKILDLVRKS